MMDVPPDKTVWDLLSQWPAESQLPAATPITRGPKFHWFGYYDKLEVDPTGRFALAMEADFEHRSPAADDAIGLGMIDLSEANRWIPLGATRAWNWQTGCMLQWRPGHPGEVIWNDRRDKRFVCIIHDINTGHQRVLPMAAGDVSPDGRWALVLDFARINDVRPGYGYAGVSDSNRGIQAPADAGVWRMDLDSGQTRLLFSVADIVNTGGPDAIESANHWINPVQWNTDSTRFLFYHRRRALDFAGNPAVAGQKTRAFTAGLDGDDIRPLAGGPSASHSIWRDPRHLVIWSDDAYRLFTDDGRCEPAVLLEAINGHHTYLPGQRWLLTDSYPMRAFNNTQQLYLFHETHRQIVPLGRFASPEPYRGEWRCDLHPRYVPGGRFVLIDSPHGDDGRQVYRIDVGDLVERLSDSD